MIENTLINTTGQIMVSLDGCLVGCSLASFKGTSTGCTKEMFNGMINGI